VPIGAIAEFNAQRRAVDARRRAAAPLDWDWEGNLVARLALWLEQQGWRELSRADAAIREHGVDLLVEKDGRTRVIEVKGWPSRTHAAGAKASQVTKWRATIGRNYFGGLVLSALILRSSRPQDEVAIAVPARKTFMALLDKIRDSLERLGIGAYAIHEDGTVQEYLAVEEVDRGRTVRARQAEREEVRRLMAMSDRDREAYFLRSNRAALKMISDARGT
jgi:hypothetical protein